MTVSDLADGAATAAEAIGKCRDPLVGRAEMIEQRHAFDVPPQGTLCNDKMYPTGVLGKSHTLEQTQGVLPNQIARYRKAAGMTQDGLARAIGTTRSTYTKLERGERSLTSEWLEKLGEALNVAPHLLIAPDGAMPSVEQLGQLLESAQQSLPAGLPYSEWPRAVAQELHMRLRTLADDRTNQDSAAN